MSPRRRLAALALALAAGACSRDKAEAERAVRAYDEAVIQAYRTRDLSKLKEVATEKEWGKVLTLVDLKTGSRLVLESELQSLEVAGVTRPGPGQLVVRTRERWRYYDRPLDPGKPQGQVFVADMTLEYQFVRERGGPWKMDAARTLSNDYLEPKGFELDPGHGRSHGAPEGAQESGSR